MKQQTQNFVNRLDRIEKLSRTTAITQKVLDRLVSSEQQQQLRLKEEVNRKYNPLRDTEETIQLFMRSTDGVSMYYHAPALTDAIQPYNLETQHKILQKSFTKADYLGQILKTQPPAVQENVHLDEKLRQKQDFFTQLITRVFQQNKYTVNQIRIQEQMFRSKHMDNIYYKMNVTRYGLPAPPIDVRVPIVCLYCIMTINDQISDWLVPFLLNNRVIDLIESIFWLIHSMVFAGKETTAQFDSVSAVEQEELLNLSDTIPDYLDVRGKNYNIQDFLRARMADDYATIERTWQGSGGRHKIILQQVLPYYCGRCVHMCFLRTFPRFKTMFSKRFVMNIYYNIIYMFTGVAPYQDFLAQSINYYFGDKIECSYQDFNQYISSSSALCGEHTDEERTVMTNIYTTEYNRGFNDVLYNDYAFQFNYVIQNNGLGPYNMGNEGNEHVLQSGEPGPINPDFTLIDEIQVRQQNYAVDVQTRRNFHGGQTVSAGSKSLSPLRAPATQGAGTGHPRRKQIKSIVQVMEDEARKVKRYQVPTSNLEQLARAEEQMAQRKRYLNSKVLADASPKKKNYQSTTKVYEIEPVMEPPHKYQEMQRQLILSMSGSQDDQKGLGDSGLSIRDLGKVGNSMLGNDHVLIRLPERFRPYSLNDTKIVDFIDQNPVTNNDVVLDFQSEEFQNYIGKALDDAKGLLQSKKPKADTKPQEAGATANKADGLNAFSNELMEQIGNSTQPVKLSSQHISITGVTPLMAHYLKVSGAPTPNNCINLIDIEGKIDYGTFKSTFYKDKRDRHAGSPVVRGYRKPLANVSVIPRSRNDYWLGGGKTDVAEFQSSRDFIGEYQEEKKRIEHAAAQKESKLRDDLKQIYIERQLFLDHALLGQAERASALAKKLGEVEETVQETIQAQQLLNGVKKSLNEKINIVETRMRIAEAALAREEFRKKKKQQQADVNMK